MSAITGEQTRIKMLLNTYDRIHDSLHDGTPLTVRYATSGREVKARTITPLALHPGKHGDLVYCEDSLRGHRITLRIDRLVAIETPVQKGARS